MDFKGPQTEVPVGNSGTETQSATGWQGMTIKDILEKVDLFNFTMLSEEEKEAKLAKEESPDYTESTVSKFKMIVLFFMCLIIIYHCIYFFNFFMIS